ncbi:alkaline phosphatase D family protein [Allorhodopirellula solitaria]|uniref:PhoD-like phosphatase n=1 Tax=Allorhodopirellula solitaria TaxID=2527987 RepID=A0A5C5WXP0_9BACT|nr:alkaline phosphatase D family protein [Allorhodopirellula solitaria]TWT55724.1 PhoD-like phosphatase [Allorhodopirellula solitaria]
MIDPTEIQRRRFLAIAAASSGAFALPAVAAADETVTPSDKFVSLREAHIGTIKIDLRIMNQFGDQPQEVQDFYVACRAALNGANPEQAVADICSKFNRHKLGGPMLGDVTPTSVAVWMHMPKPTAVTVTMTENNGGHSKAFTSSSDSPILSIRCNGLRNDTGYTYTVANQAGVELGKGQFVTPPDKLNEKPWRITFGGDFHKIGMYRPELMQLIRERGSRAMLLIGDSAVDGRKDDLPMINTDYMLRNLSPAIQSLTANVPTLATWDDHDYWGNDTSGKLTRSGKPIDVQKLRETWKSQWNNPQRDLADRKGIYFATHFGPIHYIALDTRSCRIHERKGRAGSFLGDEQMKWLEKQLADSDSPFILISGGTMWTDHISNGKDSWGIWDKEGREQIFQWIDKKSDSKAMLLSGDRHGARGFQIPRPGHKTIHEFEVGTLGGVPGPEAFGDDRTHQLFGLPSRSWAFGEFSFSQQGATPEAVFRLINEEGKVIETVTV